MLKLKSNKQIFTEIYKKNLWGGPKLQYYSGHGSHLDFIVNPYVETVIDFLKCNKITDKTIIDLGCGDFNVGLKFLDHCKEYIAVDVVECLINANKKKFNYEKLKFEILDIVNDNLPNGEICFIRQVFQHLSNYQIFKVLNKLKKYQYVFVTEHLPASFSSPNIDKKTNGDIRLSKNSGVFLEEKPFFLNVTKLLEVKIPASNEEKDYGIISTVLLKN